MKSLLLALFTLILTSIAIACGGAEAIEPTETPAAPEPTRERPQSTLSDTEAWIWLEAPTVTYQSGPARIWEGNGSLFVDVNVAPPEAVAQPAHIHTGTCSNLGGVEHRLENIIDGHSLTELPGVTLDDVTTGDLSINLHLSFADFSTFTACGEIPAAE